MSALLIILVGLRMTLFSEKYLFPIDALVVWCPTWSKNLGGSLLVRWSIECLFLFCLGYVHTKVDKGGQKWAESFPHICWMTHKSPQTHRFLTKNILIRVQVVYNCRLLGTLLYTVGRSCLMFHRPFQDRRKIWKSEGACQNRRLFNGTALLLFQHKSNGSMVPLAFPFPTALCFIPGTWVCCTVSPTYQPGSLYGR